MPRQKQLGAGASAMSQHKSRHYHVFFSRAPSGCTLDLDQGGYGIDAAQSLAWRHCGPDILMAMIAAHRGMPDQVRMTAVQALALHCGPEILVTTIAAHKGIPKQVRVCATAKVWQAIKQELSDGPLQ